MTLNAGKPRKEAGKTESKINMSSFFVPHDLTPDEAAGMTVNERLYIAGLLDKFEDAISEQNEDELRRISGRVHLGPENIDVLVEKYILKSK